MNMFCRTAAAACLMAALASPTTAGQVKLEIRDGLVTLDAKDATLREILAEWARIGQTKIINAERTPGGVMTLQLSRVPEQAALATLLRSVAGFVAAPRPEQQPGNSMYDRIMIMPAPRPAASASASTSAPGQSQPNQPLFNRGRTQPQPAIVVDDQDEPDFPQPTMNQPGGGAGAAQPGMPTAPMAPPNPQGTYGMPYGNPYNPANPATGQPVPNPALATPPSAARPGMPTPTPPAPIKGPAGENK